MKKFSGFLMVITTLAPAWSETAHATPNKPESLKIFDIKAEPARADWKAFMKGTPEYHQLIWAAQQKNGARLADWNWGWRLGWVRICGRTRDLGFCPALMQEALGDQAVVVRAEAATHLGRLWENSGNTEVTTLLQKAYGNPANYRRGKPLYVQNRILYALLQIGAPNAGSIGASLAASHPESSSYWQRLTATRF